MKKHWILGLGIIGGAFFLFANAGFRDLILRSHEKSRLESNLARLRADHLALVKEWTQIQNEPSYTEFLIRKNLGYVKKGEVEYHILVSSRS